MGHVPHEGNHWPRVILSEDQSLKWNPGNLISNGKKKGRGWSQSGPYCPNIGLEPRVLHSRLRALSFSPCGLHILLRDETGYFKINPQSGLDNDRKLPSGRSFPKLGLGTLELGAIHNVPRKQLSHHCFPDLGGQLAFPWVLQEKGR